MSETASLDEFLSKRQHEMSGGAMFKAARAPASWNKDTRTGRFVMSTQETDRDGDVVFTAGIDSAQFMKNPIALLNHRSDQPIGTWGALSKKPKSLEGDVSLIEEGKVEKADEAAALIASGILRACSIGFIPKTIKRIVMENGEPTWSWEIIECELVECSIVSIPANPMALAKSAKETRLAYDLIAEVLDCYAKDPKTGLIVPKAEYEAAHKEASGLKTIVDAPPAGWLATLKAEIISTVKGLGLPAAAAVVAKQQEIITEEQGSLPSASAILKAKAEAIAALG
jgi:HK97 family phage prohead protease